MFPHVKAWMGLLRMAGPKFTRLNKEYDNFFRGNIIKALNDEGLFEFLDTPQSIDKIASHFQYTDKAFLKEVLEILAKDKTILANGTKYQTIRPLNEDWNPLSFFDENTQDLWISYAQALPQRLKGKYVKLTEGANLFRWDVALLMELYENIRKIVFSFSGALNKPGKFLDVRFGTGYGTAVIWTNYMKKNHFYEGTKMKIYGIEPNETFIAIAKAEFPQMVTKYSGESLDKINSLKKFFPAFQLGSAEDIPYADNMFDYVYASQVLLWTDVEQSLKELLRVTKPGGIVFGAETMYPIGNPFNHLHYKVVKGATGIFHKHEFAKWAEAAGASNVEFSTPITVYKITK
ncbi:MAG: class I SAM-dependent methyltransferase [Promethearchaeota archaeon]